MLLTTRFKKTLFVGEVVSLLPVGIWPMPGVTVSGGGSGSSSLQSPERAFDGVALSGGNTTMLVTSNSNDSTHRIQFDFDNPNMVTRVVLRSDTSANLVPQGTTMQVSVGAMPLTNMVRNGDTWELSISPQLASTVVLTFNGVSGTYGYTGSAVRFSEIQMFGTPVAPSEVFFDYTLSTYIDGSLTATKPSGFTIGIGNLNSNNGATEYNICVKSNPIGVGTYRLDYKCVAPAGGILMGTSYVNGSTYIVDQYYTYGQFYRFSSGATMLGNYLNTNGVDSWFEVVVTQGAGVYNIVLRGPGFTIPSYSVPDGGVLRLCIGNQWNGSTVVKNLTKVA